MSEPTQQIHPVPTSPDSPLANPLELWTREQATQLLRRQIDAYQLASGTPPPCQPPLSFVRRPLTVAEVREIHRRYQRGDEPTSRIAADMKLDEARVREIGRARLG